MAAPARTTGGVTVTPMTPAQERMLSTWRVMALEKMPYLASVLFALRPVSAAGLGTMGVDPHARLYIDFEYAAAKGNAWASKVLLHECGHIFGDHASRSDAAGVGPHEHEISNYASDAEINDDLRDAGLDMSDGVLPESLRAEDYQTFEHYLGVLRDRTQPSQGGGDGSGDAGGPGGEGDATGQGQGDQSDSGSGSSGSGSDDQDGDEDGGFGCGSGAGGRKLPCELGSTDDLGGAAEPATQVEQERTRVATANAINEAAGSGIGSVPAGLVRQAELLLEPSKVSWRRVLSGAIKGAITAKSGLTDPTSRRPSRRHSSSRVIRPGWVSPKQRIVCVRDTSGSMGAGQINEVSSEIHGIARQVGVRDRDLLVMDVDTKVHSAVPYRNVGDLEEVSGGGGTDMGAGIVAALAERPAPTAIVVLTDGMTPWPDIDTPHCKVVAAVVGSNAGAYAHQTPDWITAVVVDDNDL